MTYLAKQKSSPSVTAIARKKNKDHSEDYVESTAQRQSKRTQPGRAAATYDFQTFSATSRSQEGQTRCLCWPSEWHVHESKLGRASCTACPLPVLLRLPDLLPPLRCVEVPCNHYQTGSRRSTTWLGRSTTPRYQSYIRLYLYEPPVDLYRTVHAIVTGTSRSTMYNVDQILLQ